MATIVLFALACLLALANLVGGLSALWRQSRGDDRGFSCAPGALLLSAAAWFTGPEPLGLWVFAPALLIPVTSLVILTWRRARHGTSAGKRENP